MARPKKSVKIEEEIEDEEIEETDEPTPVLSETDIELSILRGIRKELEVRQINDISALDRRVEQLEFRNKELNAKP